MTAGARGGVDDGAPAGHDARVAQLEQELHAARQRAQALQAQLDALHASTSWRATRPLRAAVDRLRAARQLAPVLREQLRRRGWRGLLARLLRLARSDHGGAEVARVLQHASVQARTRMPPRLHPDLADAAPEPIDACVSVIIPTLDAGPEFALLLRKLAQQQGVREIEVLVIDSGSTDGTPQRARAAGARVQAIERADFSHSGTRNLGASLARGEYLLFMVQDAYPVGDRWLHALLRFVIDHRPQGVVAASCVEACRSDSDLWVECAIATHSRFLGCDQDDRIGELAGLDHDSLRMMGQLSDVACLVRRDLFLQYRYRGSYAEDLDLGVRLIRDGHRIAMLASVKVVHSHLRSSMYTLKRGFVDVSFLHELFDDFPVAPCTDGAAVVAGALHVARELDGWRAALLDDGAAAAPGAFTDSWLQRLRAEPVRAELPAAALRLDDPRLDGFVRSLATRLDNPAAAAAQAAAAAAARAFVDDFVARMGHFNQYARALHDADDARLRHEWANAGAKAFAASLGAMLAALHVGLRSRDAADGERAWIDGLARQLTAGV